MLNPYIIEKLDELEREIAGRRPRLPGLPAPQRPARRVIGPLARAAGRRVRRAGEALEAWASPSGAREDAPL